MNSSRPSERGSAIIFIFIMIAIFAALSFAVSSSMRVGSGTANVITEEKSRLNTTDFLNNVQALNMAVQTLIVNGCRPEQISYENTVVTGYINSFAPGDKRCHVFRPEGGGIKWFDASSLNDGTPVYYPNDLRVVGLSKNAALEPALGFYIMNVTRDACLAVNKALAVPSFSGEPPEDFGYNENRKFQGTFAPDMSFGDDYSAANRAAIVGRKIACLKTVTRPSAGIYFIYNVAYVR